MKKIFLKLFICSILCFGFYFGMGSPLSLKPVLSPTLRLPLPPNHVFNNLSVPFSFSSIDTTVDTFYDLFRSIDSNELKKAIDNNDTLKILELLQDPAINVSTYLYSRYGEDFRDYARDYPLETITIGFFFQLRENNFNPDSIGSTDNSGSPSYRSAFDCFVGAVAGLLGIRDIMNLYNDFLHGVSASTVFGTLRTMLRRVAGVITVAIAVYELLDCLF